MVGARRQIDHNPCKGVRKGTESPRQTFLSAAEIAAAHKALDASNNRAAALALRLTLLTGCRIGEVLNAGTGPDRHRARDLVEAGGVHQAETTAHRPAAARGAEGRAGIAGHRRPDLWRRPLAVGARQCGDRSARMPDPRSETFTGVKFLARAGASLVEIGAVLGHTKAQTTQRYTHLVGEDLRKLVERAR